MEPFKLERYFAEYEFKARYLLSPSDCESLSLQELLSMADPEALRLWEGLSLGYTESQGHPQLCEEISRLYEKISPLQAMVAVPEEAIYIAMHTLLHPGDHVVALFPAYQSLYEVARSIGCEVSLWSIQPSERGWQLDLDELKHLLKKETRLLVINFPHNPTGYLPSRQEWEAILEIASAQGLYVFSDEMYRLLEYDPSDRLPSACDAYPRAITLSGLSKSLAAPGLRIGWLATQAPGLIDQWLAFKDYTSICSSAPSEILALITLRTRARILQRCLGIVQSNLETAGRFFLRNASLFRWLPPRAGSVAFPQWLGRSSVEEFCRLALEQQSVMILPGSIFDYPGSYFRVGLGRKNLPEALEKLEAVLDAAAA